MNRLKDKKILLCVTGSIAAYKACEFIRLLKKQNCFIQVAMTESAQDFIGKLSLSSLSGNKVILNKEQTGLDHVNFAIEFDVVVVLPSTANILCKAASGVADDMVSTILSICEQPKIFVPAMNYRMWQGKATQNAVAILRSNKSVVMDPDEGFLATLHKGEGRLPELHHVINEIRLALNMPTPLKGKRALITAGPTREPIDPVRFVSNKSSGKMGYSFAKIIRDLGGESILISGPVAIEPPSETTLIKVETANDMFIEMNKFLNVDFIIMCAAVSDYSPTIQVKEKIKSKKSSIKIDMHPTIDIIKDISKKTNAIIIAFALETSNGIANAKNKLFDKGADYIILNHPDDEGCGIESNYNKVVIIDRKNNTKEISKDRKDRIAKKIMDFVLESDRLIIKN